MTGRPSLRCVIVGSPACARVDLFDGEERRQHPEHLRREQRSGEHVTGVALGDDLAVAEHDGAGRAPRRELDVVGGEHDRAAGCGVLRDRAVERGARRGVHAARRLVEQEHRRAADRDRRDRDALALAAREAARVAVGEVVQAERVEPVVDVAVVAACRAAAASRSTSRRTVGCEQQRVRVLRHVRDRAPSAT